MTSPKHPREDYVPRPEILTTPDDVCAIFNTIEDDQESLNHVILTLIESMTDNGTRPFEARVFTQILAGTILDLGFTREVQS